MTTRGNLRKAAKVQFIQYNQLRATVRAIIQYYQQKLNGIG